jgi:hypothetical protein
MTTPLGRPCSESDRGAVVMDDCNGAGRKLAIVEHESAGDRRFAKEARQNCVRGPDYGDTSGSVQQRMATEKGTKYGQLRDVMVVNSLK